MVRYIFNIFSNFCAILKKQNFGAIGSIMGHEITHSFDDQASKIHSWSKKSQNEYKERVKCIINQYSQMRVKEVEEFIKEYYNEDVSFFLNGTVTKNEDIA
jgi:predicted metalloendopeptidase